MTLLLASFSAYVGYMTGNKLINAAIVAWFSAQVLKVIVEVLTHKEFDFRRILGAGGMPSSHSATVCAVAAAAFKLCGMSSTEFGIASTFAFIVMFDALNVRRAAGEQAKILNYMMKNWQHLTPEIFGKELKEILGHTPFQVFVGAAFGIAVGFLM